MSNEIKMAIKWYDYNGKLATKTGHLYNLMVLQGAKDFRQLETKIQELKNNRRFKEIKTLIKKIPEMMRDEIKEAQNKGAQNLTKDERSKIIKKIKDYKTLMKKDIMFENEIKTLEESEKKNEINERFIYSTSKHEGGGRRTRGKKRGRSKRKSTRRKRSRKRRKKRRKSRRRRR